MKKKVKGVLRWGPEGAPLSRMTDVRALAKRPNNRWCQNCKNWIHKDRFARHCKAKHGIVLKTVSVNAKQTVAKTAGTLKQTPIKNQALKKRAADRFPEPLYERQPRFEGGIRWEQGGSPGLGKRR